MKHILLITFLFLVGLINAQSKKEQIEILTKRVDSLNSVVGSERKLNLDKSTKISELTNTIANLESSISILNADLSKLTSELQQIKTESASKTQDLAKLQAQLKTKTDSLDLVLGELEKLKPAPKPVVSINTNLTNNQVIQTGPFKSVKIGTQIWMTENLNVSTFRNGDPIPEAKTNEEWKKAGEEGKPAWCYYDNDPNNGKKYGKLYNCYAVIDARQLAPEGWHIPTFTECKELNFDDEKLKSTLGWDNYETGGFRIECLNCKNWNSEYRRKNSCHQCKDTRDSGKKTPVKIKSGNGNNITGFSALPGGERWDDGKFNGLAIEGNWWLSTDLTWAAHDPKSSRTWFFQLKIQNQFDSMNAHDKGYGLSIRCVKD